MCRGLKYGEPESGLLEYSVVVCREVLLEIESACPLSIVDSAVSKFYWHSKEIMAVPRPLPCYTECAGESPRPSNEWVCSRYRRDNGNPEGRGLAPKQCQLIGREDCLARSDSSGQRCL